MRVVPAQGQLLEQILDDTYPIWNEGLTRQAYGQWNKAQMRTPWGSTHLERLALVDENGDLLSSAKRYRITVRIDGRELEALGIGALFTPRARRGRGHASTLLDLLMEQARAEGAALAMLFSEIGTPFYERLGFRPVSIDQVRIGVKLVGGSPAMLVRAGHEKDLPALVAMHDVRTAGSRFALRRDVPHIQFMLTRKRLLAGLGATGSRSVEFHVAEEGPSAVAYVILSVDARGWTLVEAGDRDPAGARLGAMLQVLLAREPSIQPPPIRAWWPRRFPVPPQLEIAERHKARDVLMMRPLDDAALPASADEVFYWRSDFF
jgi:GNAT superfamily N-acetyltransferase